MIYFFLCECGFELPLKTVILCLYITLTNVVTLHTGKIKKYIYLGLCVFSNRSAQETEQKHP